MVDVPAPGGVRSPRRRLGLPRPPIRVRMALSYCGLFVASGAVLLAVTVGLWQGETVTTHVSSPSSGPTVSTTQSSDLDKLLIMAAFALAIMAVVSLLFGWLVAGRFLAPVRAITDAARRISASSLDERLALDGPGDDLKELADTIDGLLARLERSFEAERRFAASASHELRTPLATMRVWLDVAVAKPEPPPQIVGLADRIRTELDHVDALVDSLLVLGRTHGRPLDGPDPFALSSALAASLRRRGDAIAARALEVGPESDSCEQAWVFGNGTLLTRMVENVVDNAVRHNRPGGWIRARAEADVEQAVVRLVVENSGAVLTAEDVSELAQPFRRVGAARTGSGEGTGLGLSIVKAIAEAHGGGLGLDAREGGGLRVVVTLPLAADVMKDGG